MKRIVGTLVLLLAITLTISTQAQTTYEIKSHTLTVEGTSNLHDWTADVQKVNGTFKLKVENRKISNIENLKINIDAKSLKGSKGSIMDSKINDALGSKKHPVITFDLIKVNSITESAGKYGVSTTGNLNISGVSKTINLSATGKVNTNGEVEFTGKTKIKMSDFSVKPPTAMFGALTTGDEITLSYTVVVKPNLLSVE